MSVTNIKMNGGFLKWGSKMIDMDKMCSGCYEYECYIENPDTYSECVGHKQKHKKCPCRNCIVKSMCNEVCEEYKKVWTSRIKGVFND